MDRSCADDVFAITESRKLARTYTVLYRSTDLWWLGGGSDAWLTGFEQSFHPFPSP